MSKAQALRAWIAGRPAPSNVSTSALETSSSSSGIVVAMFQPVAGMYKPPATPPDGQRRWRRCLPWPHRAGTRRHDHAILTSISPPGGRNAVASPARTKSIIAIPDQNLRPCPALPTDPQFCSISRASNTGSASPMASAVCRARCKGLEKTRGANMRRRAASRASSASPPR